MLQDLREAEQRRQTLTVSLALFYQPGEIDAHIRHIRVGTDADVPQFVHVVIVVAPPGNVIGAQHSAGILIAHSHLLHRAQSTLFAC